MPTELKPLTEADFGTLAALSSTIWHAHYSWIISTAQIDYMLADRNTPENLSRYVNSTERWLDLLWLDGRAVGYCGRALLPHPDEMKLEQLYLLPELHGRGLGALMLRHVESAAHAAGRTRLVLQVNRRNLGSIAFYRKAGFVVREETVLDLGNGYVMDDYVMEKNSCP